MLGVHSAAQLAAQFRREASALALVHHPGLPAVVEVGQIDELPYIVMEYVEGRTLLSVLEQGRLSESQVVAIATTLAGALAAVHRQGVTHRDVQPRNIILNAGIVKLIDFGFAAYTTPDSDQAHVLGTLRYSSPEQTGLLKRPVDGRSDLYALGAMLFECVAGVPPFNATQAGELIRQHAVIPAPDVRQFRSEVSPAFAAILARLLAKDPDDRYQTAEGLLSDLDQIDHLNGALRLGRPVRLAVDDQWTDALYEDALVGRDKELAQLRQLWREARHGRGTLALVESAPGMGKSHLGRELLHRARSSGGLILAGTCASDLATPFTLLRSAFEHYAGYLEHMPQAQRQHAEETIRQIVGVHRPAVRRIFPVLAPMLPAGETDSSAYDQEAFSDMLAELVLWMSKVYPAAVWLIDDIGQIDDGSFIVIKRVINALHGAPLLMIATLGDDARSTALRERLLSGFSGQCAQLALAPLEEPAARLLISAYLGGYAVDERISSEIVARSAGSPFAIREYVQTILDAGMLRLTDARWVVDDHSFDRLQLPTNVLPLVLNRIDSLDEPTRTILRTAALLGFQFRRNLLVRVWDGEVHDVNLALSVGVRSHLIERSASGGYHFSHQSVHEVFLASFGADERKATHRHIASTLDDGDQTIEEIYRIAHHYVQGESVDPAISGRAYAVTLSAGRIAATNYAYDEAYAFLRHAYELSQRLGYEFDAPAEDLFGEVCYRSGHSREALTHFSQAIERTPYPHQRALLRIKRAYVQVWTYDTAAIMPELIAAFAELDEPFQLSARGNLLSAAGNVVKYGLALATPWAPRRARGVELERLLILEKLQQLLGTVAYLNSDLPLLLNLLFRSLYAAERIGPAAETVRVQSNFAVLAASVGLDRLAHRHMRKSLTMAAQLGERPTVAHAALYQAMAVHMLGRSREAEQLMRHCLEDNAAVLDAVEYSQGCSDITLNLYLRGYVLQAWEWTRRGMLRVEQAPSYHSEAHYLRSWAAPLLLTLGDTVGAQEYMRPDDAPSNGAPSNLARLGTVLCSQLIVLLEHGDRSEALEALLRRFQRMNPNRPRHMMFYVRHFYVLQAYARLYQAMHTPSGQAGHALRRLEGALKQLKAIARLPIFRGHYLVALAGLQRLRGNYLAALKTLGEADVVALTIDSPWMTFEASRQRSYALTAQGQTAAARREAGRAYELALEHGWVNRARQVRHEFSLEEGSLTLSSVTSSAPTGDGTHPDALKTQRHLDALLQVSLAWATVRDPDQQAQIALDAVIRILGAERAFLFLLEDDSLVFRAGRDALGSDIRSSGDYSRSLIERVRVSRTPIIVSSTEDGILSDVESVVARNLRSVLIAPLLLDSKLLGVVYLDNRLAWGMFSKGDVEILRAIANHIALALETARTAQLEINVAAERQGRRLAETMRTLLTVLNSSLDLSVVLDKALTSIAELIPYDSACIALCNKDYFQFVALKGAANSAELRHMHLPIKDDALFAEMNVNRQPIVIADSLLDSRFNGYGNNPARSWLGIPLVVHDEVVGFMAIDRNQPDAITERDAEIGMIFAAQAGVAIANARLFGEVQRLAVTDGLTEINNRRHFFELAEREWIRTRRYDHPLSAMMLDVDHFKRVNDTFGHATGDSVLRTVAQICRNSLRETDFLGRYGGEEFAIMLPDTDLSAAHATAERLRESIAGTPIHTDKGDLQVTVSIGVASITVDMNSVATLLDRADRGLYIAKDTGRNRVVMT
jgi:eukaryotic-like serine/threonine-protein kinase